MNNATTARGKVWFEALTGNQRTQQEVPASLLVAESVAALEGALCLCIQPNPQSRFPCARQGQVGLEEAYALALHIRSAIKEDRDKTREQKRPVLAIVDVKSQAYGKLEEAAGIFQAAACAADAYASARMAGHPVITLIAGHAFSGGFLTHGFQANRILAFDDAGIMVHAMHREAAARITRRPVEDLERLGHEILPMSYDIRDFAKLGLLDRLLHVKDVEHPSSQEVAEVMRALREAIADARSGPVDLRHRIASSEALKTRTAGIQLQALMKKQWDESEEAQ